MGARAYTLLEEFLDFGEGECVIEVGSERGEGSTEWLARNCHRRGIVFHTIDVDPAIWENACKIVARYPGSFAHLARGEEFLANDLTERVRFAYLDGADYVTREIVGMEFVHNLRQRYEHLGLEMTNALSESSHLTLVALIESHSAMRCALVIDDTYARKRRWLGKGARAVPYLKARGFAIRDLGGAVLAYRMGDGG